MQNELLRILTMVFIGVNTTIKLKAGYDEETIERMMSLLSHQKWKLTQIPEGLYV